MNAFASRQTLEPLFKGRFVVILSSIGLFLAALFTSVPVYGGWLSGSDKDLYRFGVPLMWGILALLTLRDDRLNSMRTLLLSLCGVSLGFALAHLIDRAALDWLKLSASTPQGAAVAKLSSEAIPLCASILLAALVTGLSFRSLSLVGGRHALSLVLGLLATIPLLLLFALDPSGGSKAVFALPQATLLAWLPWIAAFSLANGFMEELWFRGLWLTTFGQVIGRNAAMHVTSFAFCVMHVIVYWQDPTTVLILSPVWLFMGYAYALIVRKTGSLWGPVLAHALADVLFMYIYFTKV